MEGIYSTREYLCSGKARVQERFLRMNRELEEEMQRWMVIGGQGVWARRRHSK